MLLQQGGQQGVIGRSELVSRASQEGCVHSVIDTGSIKSSRASSLLQGFVLKVTEPVGGGLFGQRRFLPEVDPAFLGKTVDFGQFQFAEAQVLQGGDVLDDLLRAAGTDQR